MTRASIIFCFCALLCCRTLSLSAITAFRAVQTLAVEQDSTNELRLTLAGSITGTVQTPDGKPASGIRITLKSVQNFNQSPPNSQAMLGAVTNERGVFTLDGVRAGAYTLVASSQRYAKLSQPVLVRSGEKTELILSLAERSYSSDEVVVSASRSERDIEDMPLPVTVISRKQIEAQGAVRLDEVLAEQTGLTLVYNHGAGVQMQGLDPAYTLVLIDGEPIVGRTAGTLELTRFTIANIERIEIVRGPSSSLYGSEALAGVINIITRKPDGSGKPLSASLRTRYGSFNQFDASALVEAATRTFGGSIAANRNSSDGYDLTPETQGRTTPRFVNYTISPRFFWNISPATTFNASARLLTEQQTQRLDGSSPSETLDYAASLLDWNVSANVQHRFDAASKLTAKWYSSRYQNNFVETYADGKIFFASDFDQFFHKAETQFETAICRDLTLVAGVGGIWESVLSERVEGAERRMSTQFAFAQAEWMPTWTLAEDLPSQIVSLTASARFDRNSDFGSQLSPKLALMLRPFDAVSFKASVGTGFKAPTFQQLYLDFTNAAAGYSVFGSMLAREGMKRLADGGLIRQLIRDPAALQHIEAERSFSVNVGVEIMPTQSAQLLSEAMQGISLKINGFRNVISNLIETAPIAVKTNGANVFTYFNVRSAFTQGLEAECSWKPLHIEGLRHWSFVLGYQFVEAKDEQVLADIRAGKYGRNDGSPLAPRFVQLTEAEYGGLFNRSKHSGIAKLLYDNLELGITATLRATMRGRWGFADLNGNLILDAENEYAPGYTLLDCTVNYTLPSSIVRGVRLQAGVDNISGVVNPQTAPWLAGRLFYCGFTWQIL